MIDQTAFDQIANTLAEHYDSVFYVDPESGHYTVFVQTQMFKELDIPGEGEDFFAMVRANAHKYVHPDDLELALSIHDKDTILENLKKNGSYSVSCRLVIDTDIVHIRHVDILCKDKNRAVVEMTLPEDNAQIFASKYETVLPSKETLQKLLTEQTEET